MDVQRYADKLINEAIARGEMEPATGVGEPLPPMAQDPDWWVRAFLERETLPDRHDELRRSVLRRVDTAITAESLDEAREILAGANADVVRWNAEAPDQFHLEERSEIWLVTERAKRPVD